MRPLSFKTSFHSHDKKIPYQHISKFNEWIEEYKDLYDKIKNGSKVFFIVENKNSNKNGYVGYIEDVADFPNPESITSHRDETKFSVNLNVGDKTVKIINSWLLFTDEIECSDVRRAPIKVDIFGKSISINDYVIWSKQTSMKSGYVCEISDSGAIYVCEFGYGAAYKINIRYPGTDLVVIDKNNTNYKIMTKNKLRSM